jgi:hypothetical protein
MLNQYDRGIPRAFIKGIVKKVHETGTLHQLYELFIKYKTYLLEDAVASAFLNRVDFLEEKLSTNYDIEKAQELRSDIESERNVYQVSNPKITTSTITLVFNSTSGSLFKDCVRELLIMAIDKFKGQKAAVSAFLGITEQDFVGLVKNDSFVKNHWENVKKKNKKQLGS